MTKIISAAYKVEDVYRDKMSNLKVTEREEILRHQDDRRAEFIELTLNCGSPRN